MSEYSNLYLQQINVAVYGITLDQIQKADLLQKYAKKYDYNSIVSMISYNNSTVEKYKKEAENAIDYRDRLYTYHYNFINDLDRRIKNNDPDIADFVIHYNNYIKGLPQEEGNE